MNQDMSILHLVLNASLVVQLVMLLLIVVSITSWAAIFRKLIALKRVKAINDVFEREFWSGTNLNDLFAAASQNARDAGPLELVDPVSPSPEDLREMARAAGTASPAPPPPRALPASACCAR